MRGAVDDKAQMWMHVKALESLMVAGGSTLPEVNVIELAARNAAGSMIAEIYLAAASSLTGMPRALATPSP
jgi:hypothetical protein